ncbi:MAG TPA: hypothetical protein VM510_06320 [Caulifigura sp.]|nr:hypothetical protein [Caulifigura sp.]
MSQFVETATKTLVAGAAIAEHLRVKLTAGEVAVAGASDPSIGTMEVACFAAGNCTVRLATAQGTRKMVAAGSITAGNPVYAAASGKIASSGTVLEGIALQAAGANNDVIEVLGPQAPVDVSTSISGTTAAGFTVDSDSSAAKVAINTNSATGNYTATLVPPNLAADATITLPGVTSTLATNKPIVEAHTSGDTLAASESGSVHTTVGASGTVTYAMPAAVVGLQFFFRVGAAQELRIDPNGSETIALPSTGVAGGAGKYLTANADGETVHLMCTKAGEWSVFGYTGTWTAEP